MESPGRRGHGTWMSTRVLSAGPQPPEGGRSRTALALAVVTLVLAIAVLHSLISSIGSVCRVIPSGRVYGVCRTVGVWVHFPGSLLEIFWAIALTWGASIGVTAGVRFVNARAHAWARSRRAARRVSSLAEARNDQEMPLKGRRCGLAPTPPNECQGALKVYGKEQSWMSLWTVPQLSLL
jgi:hypothetical protein